MAMPLKIASSMSSSRCSSSSMRLRYIIQTLIISRISRLIREIFRASSILVRVLKKKQYSLLLLPKRASKKQKSNILFGSFRLHYNFCSSHVVPVSAPVRLPEELYLAHLHYGSTLDSTDAFELDGDGNIQEPDQLSSYLRQLEDKVKDGQEEEGKEMMMMMMNEIDKLADMFIEKCHEKFMLEKVDSYRRFQDMLSRSG